MADKVATDGRPTFKLLIKGDIRLLKKYGVDGLKEMEYYGVLDRLIEAKLIKDTEVY